MAEIRLSQSQLEDSVASLDKAVQRVFAASERDQGHYQPTEIVAPRPAFSLYQAQLEQLLQSGAAGIEKKPNRYTIGPSQAEVLRNFAGLRGLASFSVKTARGVHIMVGPAIVLNGGQAVSILTAERAIES